jgi:hypothetical protein
MADADLFSVPRLTTTIRSVPVVLFRGKLKSVMKKLVRVGLGFATLPKDQLNSYVILGIVCLTKQIALVPNLPVTIAALTALQEVYQAGLTAAALGGQKDTAALKEARNELVAALRQIAAYIQSLNLTESQVLTLGFDVVVWSNTKITLLAPTGITLDNSSSTQLGVYLSAVAGAKAYHVQYCIGTGAWLEAGIWPNTRDIYLLNLTPGTIYTVRIRAIGGSTQYGPWSASISLMCT